MDEHRARFQRVVIPVDEKRAACGGEPLGREGFQAADVGLLLDDLSDLVPGGGGGDVVRILAARADGQGRLELDELGAEMVDKGRELVGEGPGCLALEGKGSPCPHAGIEPYPLEPEVEEDVADGSPLDVDAVDLGLPDDTIDVLLDAVVGVRASGVLERMGSTIREDFHRLAIFPKR